MVPKHVSLKVPVFPFNKFPHTDIVLGPEMRSTGEVMGIDEGFGMAFAKAMLAAGQKLPLSGTVFLSVRDSDKRHVVGVAKELEGMGFRVISTEGTAEFLASKGVVVEAIPKIQEGVRPNIIDRIKNGEVQLIVNTPTGRGPKRDEAKMRMAAVMHNVPVIATISGARAAVEALKVLRTSKMGVKPLQEYHPAQTIAKRKA